jgi:hypothetical protein
MRYFRRGEGGPNFIVGIFLLVVLGMLAGPNFFPRLISNVLPGFDEGVPCAWLKTADDRAFHQSLLGRAAENPIALSVRANPITRDPAAITSVIITVRNNSLGTVPLYFDPTAVTVGDNGTSGLGLIFSPPNSLSAGFRAGDPASFPEANIHLLAPRQSCVHRVEFPNGNILIDPSISSGTASVRAFYRMNSSGQTFPQAGVVATPIYVDQGLWVGYVESDPIPMPVISQ